MVNVNAAGNTLNRNVSIREHADGLAVLIDYNEAADVFDAHLSGAFPDAFFRSDNGYLMDGHIDDFE
ncbi:hypothetical protein K470107D9_00690 [Sutterella wadsworthensis]